jgi:hypothetical protein
VRDSNSYERNTRILSRNSEFRCELPAELSRRLPAFRARNYLFGRLLNFSVLRRSSLHDGPSEWRRHGRLSVHPDDWILLQLQLHRRISAQRRKIVLPGCTRYSADMCTCTLCDGPAR